MSHGFDQGPNETDTAYDARKLAERRNSLNSAIGTSIEGQQVTIGGETFTVVSYADGKAVFKAANGLMSDPLPMSQFITGLGDIVQVRSDGIIDDSSSATAVEKANFAATGNVNIAGQETTLPSGTTSIPGTNKVEFIDSKGNVHILTPPTAPSGPAPPTPFDLASLDLTYKQVLNQILSGEFDAKAAIASMEFDFQRFEADLAFNQADLNLTEAIDSRRDERERQIAESSRQTRVAEEAGRRAGTIKDLLPTLIPGLKSFGGTPVNTFSFNDIFQSNPGQPGDLAGISPIPGKSAVVMPDIQLPGAGAPPNFPQAPNFQQPSPGIRQFLASMGFA